MPKYTPVWDLHQLFCVSLPVGIGGPNLQIGAAVATGVSSTQNVVLDVTFEIDTVNVHELWIPHGIGGEIASRSGRQVVVEWISSIIGIGG